MSETAGQDDTDANPMLHEEVQEPSADTAAFMAMETHNSKWAKNGFGNQVPSKQSGKFSAEETAIVKQAIENYCSARNFDVSRLCSECDHKAELKGAWMEIAKCLPHRSVQSVYRHGIRQCHPFKRGTWSVEETTLLSDLVQNMGKKWSSIQNKLNRSADSCRDKYREMSEEFVKGRWREAETENLQKIIREHLNVDPDISMVDLGKYVEERGIQIPWSVISKKMGKRSRLSCFKKWQKMTGLTGPVSESLKREADDDSDGPSHKRSKIDDTGSESVVFASAGAASAAAIAAGNGEYDMYHSAKIADETVEAVDLPDTNALGATTIV